MPTYDYECARCGIFELYQPITEPARKRCPTCRSRVTRLVSGGGGIIFKGTGFHVTDYRSDSYKRAAAADKPGGASGGDSQANAAPPKRDTKKDATKKAG